VGLPNQQGTIAGDNQARAAAPAALWDQVLDVLRDRVNPQAFNTWLRPTLQKSLAGGLLVVAVPSLPFADWIGRTYIFDIHAALEQLGQQALKVEFSAAETRPRQDVPPPLRPSSPAAPSSAPVSTKRGSLCRKCSTERMPKFGVSSGLLAHKHLNAMKNALATFLWCVDRQTGPHGLVLGGCPVTHAQIAESIPCSTREISRQLERLETHGYITAERRQRGLILRVNNQKKFGSCRCAGGAL